MRRMIFIMITLLPICSMANVIEYDSLYNINKNNIDQLIGQVLFYPKTKYIWSDLFWKNKNGKIYKYDKNNSRLLNGKYSKDDEVLGEDFLIKAVIHNGKHPLLECRKLSDNDIVYINCFYLENEYPPFCVRGFYEKMKSLYVNKTIYVNKRLLEDYRLLTSDLDVENNQEIVKLKCESIHISAIKYGAFVYLKAKGGRSNKAYEIPCDERFLLTTAKVDSIRNAYLDKVELEIIEKALQQKRIAEEINRNLLKKYVYDDEGNKQIWYYVNRLESPLERFEAYTIAKIEKCENSNQRYIIEFEKRKDSEKILVTVFLDENLCFSFLERECSKSDYKKLYPKVKNWNAIKEGVVRLGMTPQEVRLSWGNPKDINVSKGIWGVHEQWVYEDEYVYFENGKVTAVQY